MIAKLSLLHVQHSQPPAAHAAAAAAPSSPSGGTRASGQAGYATDVCKLLSELGVLWVKLGQTLSVRPDLVGPRLAAALAGLQVRRPGTERSCFLFLQADLVVQYTVQNTPVLCLGVSHTSRYNCRVCHITQRGSSWSCVLHTGTHHIVSSCIGFVHVQQFCMRHWQLPCSCITADARKCHMLCTACVYRREHLLLMTLKLHASSSRTWVSRPQSCLPGCRQGLWHQHPWVRSTRQHWQAMGQWWPSR